MWALVICKVLLLSLLAGSQSSPPGMGWVFWKLMCDGVWVARCLLGSIAVKGREGIRKGGRVSCSPKIPPRWQKLWKEHRPVELPVLWQNGQAIISLPGWSSYWMWASPRKGGTPGKTLSWVTLNTLMGGSCLLTLLPVAGQQIHLRGGTRWYSFTSMTPVTFSADPCWPWPYQSACLEFQPIWSLSAGSLWLLAQFPVLQCSSSELRIVMLSPGGTSRNALCGHGGWKALLPIPVPLDVVHPHPKPHPISSIPLPSPACPKGPAAWWCSQRTPSGEKEIREGRLHPCQHGLTHMYSLNPKADASDANSKRKRMIPCANICKTVSTPCKWC